MGHGHAGLGELPEGRGDLGSDPLLYDFTGQRPRAREEAGDAMTSSLRSREFTPKRELRLGKPCEGCLAEAAEPRRRTFGPRAARMSRCL